MRFADYPDAVVANYLDRVQALEPMQRDALDGSALTFFFQSLITLRLEGAMAAAVAPLVARAGIKMSIAEATPEALLEYRKFWENIRRQGWGVFGQMKIAAGLYAVRKRIEDQGDAQRHYQRVMGKIVPRESVGWIDAPTA
jgi:hypothetical protein